MAEGYRQVDRAPSGMFGESGFERVANDFYETPAWCVDALVDEIGVPEDGLIWEPAAGKGAIVSAANAHGAVCHASDLVSYPGAPAWGGQDFLSFAIPPHDRITSIWTNPPYALATEFVTHAIRLVRPWCGQVAMLLRHEWDCASTRTHLFDRPPFARKLTLTKRPRWSDEDKASPRFNFAWFIWDWRHEGPAVLAYGPRKGGRRQGNLPGLTDG